MHVIETDRLILRRLQIEDAEELHRIYSNPVTMKFMGKGFDSVADGRVRIQKHIETYYEKYGFGLWATVLKENKRLIGRCGLLYEELEGVKDLEIAGLIDCDYWGRGLALEALRAILKIGFDEYQFKRIIAIILPDNVNSIRAAEKIGLRFEREIADYKNFGKARLYAINSESNAPTM